MFVHFSPIDHDEENDKDHELILEKERNPATSQSAIEGDEILKKTLNDIRRRANGFDDEDDNLVSYNIIRLV